MLLVIAIASKEMWISILHHVVDEHEWLLAESGEGKCAHEPLSADERNKPWLKKNTPVHNALREVVMDKNLLSGSLSKSGPLHFGSENSFPSNFSQ